MNLAYKVKTFVRILYLQRFFIVLFVALIPFFSVSHPQVMVILFLVCWAVFCWFTGSYGSFYIVIYSKMVPIHQRGRFRGYSSSIGNLAALGSVYLTGVILAGPAFPYNFMVVFAIGAVLLLLEAFNYSLLKEVPDEVQPFKLNYIEYFKLIPVMFRENPRFMRIVGGFTFIVISQVSLAYYVLYALRVYDVDAKQVVLFTAITIVINIFGNAFFGIMADKVGHRKIVLIAGLFGGAAGVLILGVHELWAVYAAYALTNLCVGCYNLSSENLLLLTVDKDKLPMSMSINMMVTLVVSSVMTIGSGFVIEYSSFGAVFAATAAAGFIASLIFRAGRTAK